MQPVPASPLLAPPARRGARRRRSGSRAALGLFAAALLAAGAVTAAMVGDRSAPPRRHAAGLVGGVPLQLARCEQWRAADASQRAATLDALGSVVGGPAPGGRGTTLTRSDATRLFDNECASPIAQGFLLYELYTRAAAFSRLAPH